MQNILYIVIYIILYIVICDKGSVSMNPVSVYYKNDTTVYL